MARAISSLPVPVSRRSGRRRATARPGACPDDLAQPWLEPMTPATSNRRRLEGRAHRGWFWGHEPWPRILRIMQGSRNNSHGLAPWFGSVVLPALMEASALALVMSPAWVGPGSSRAVWLLTNQSIEDCSQAGENVGLVSSRRLAASRFSWSALIRGPNAGCCARAGRRFGFRSAGSWEGSSTRSARLRWASGSGTSPRALATRGRAGPAQRHGQRGLGGDQAGRQRAFVLGGDPGQRSAASRHILHAPIR